MNRAEIAGLIASGYLVLRFLWLRLRLLRQRRAGVPLAPLRDFDFRAIWDELLGADATPGAPAPCADAPVAPAAYRRSPWELAAPPRHAPLRDALARGETPSGVAGDADAAQLLLHFAIRRVLTGELDGAARLASELRPDQREPMLATVALARAEALAREGQLDAARRAAHAARGHAGRAWRRAPSAGLAYLLAHLRLCWGTHVANLELSVALAQWRLRRARRAWGELPFLHLASAHAHALMAQEAEAVDAIGRALYHARGDRFYARVVIDNGYLARARPALVAQCRAMLEGERPAAPSADGG